MQSIYTKEMMFTLVDIRSLKVNHENEIVIINTLPTVRMSTNKEMTSGMFIQRI